MAFVPIPNTAEVAVRFLQDGQNLANVWHVAYEGFGSDEKMGEIAQRTIEIWQTNVRPIVSNAVTLLEVSVVDQSIEGGFAALASPVTNNTGALADAMMPNSTTVAVKKATGRAGRSYRGRLYHIGLCENQVLANRIAPVVQTSINAAYAAYIGGYGTISCTWVVASTYSNQAPRAIGVVTPILAVSVDPVIDSQRRRLPGRGR